MRTRGWAEGFTDSDAFHGGTLWESVELVEGADMSRVYVEDMEALRVIEQGV